MALPARSQGDPGPGRISCGSNRRNQRSELPRVSSTQCVHESNSGRRLSCQRDGHRGRLCENLESCESGFSHCSRPREGALGRHSRVRAGHSSNATTRRIREPHTLYQTTYGSDRKSHSGFACPRARTRAKAVSANPERTISSESYRTHVADRELQRRIKSEPVAAGRRLKGRDRNQPCPCGSGEKAKKCHGR